MKRHITFVVGPTGVGKSAYALNLAKEKGLSIISADSRQIYRGMSIGTDAPPLNETKEVEHFFIRTKDITSTYSAYQYAQDALPIIENHLNTVGEALIVGGSMLYIQSLLFKMDDIPPTPSFINDALWEDFRKNGVSHLSSELRKIDPIYLSKIDPNNHKRIIRALGVYKATGRPYSSYHTATPRIFDAKVTVISITRPREVLYSRINQRVLQMFQNGLLLEVERLLPYRSYNALNTIGYKECFELRDGLISLEECIRKIQKNTRTFAKQQISFFSKLSSLKKRSWDYKEVEL